MNLNPRQSEILQLARQLGFVEIESLAARFDVTQQTIRRDINQLCDQAMLRRFHGGAGWPSSAVNIDYATRQVLYLEEKQRIAALVAKHIPDEASLFINIGTTNEEIARRLANHRGLRVITNNLNVAAILGRNASCEIFVTGGVVRARDLGITGEMATENIHRFKVDFGIIGISGIDADGTLRNFDLAEVLVSSAIVKQSRKVFLAADHSKFGRRAFAALGHLGDLDALFTDQPLPPETMEILAEGNVEVHVADPEPGEQSDLTPPPDTDSDLGQPA
jgi:DeoR family glycerol-3-phosphate regulon repressor